MAEASPHDMSLASNKRFETEAIQSMIKATGGNTTFF